MPSISGRTPGEVVQGVYETTADVGSWAAGTAWKLARLSAFAQYTYNPATWARLLGGKGIGWKGMFGLRGWSQRVILEDRLARTAEKLFLKMPEGFPEAGIPSFGRRHGVVSRLAAKVAAPREGRILRTAGMGRFAKWGVRGLGAVGMAWTGVALAGLAGHLIFSAARGLMATASTLGAVMDQMSYQDWGPGVNPFMSPQAATERRRAVSRIRASGMNLRAALGQEAVMYH